MVDRDNVLNVRISDEERAMLTKLSKELGISQSSLVRLWIREQYESRWDRPPRRKKRKA